MKSSMTKPKAIVGPPGTGKTSTLIGIVKHELSKGMQPERVGFLSFSRKATEEARSRAVEELNIESKRLLHFRTLHSLAFKQLGLRTDNVLRPVDYERLEQLVGLEFKANRSMTVTDGEFFRFGAPGDMYLSIISMARTRGVSLEEQFNDYNNPTLDFRQLKILEKALFDYKQSTKKIDFVDMVEKFIDQGEAPELDLLIVDEAQDLVPLQWDMVDKLLTKAGQTYYAGDDDQTIYEWMGVDPANFIDRCENRTVLKNSYRVPYVVHQLAERVIEGVDQRVPKEWEPTEHEGRVLYHYDMDDIDMSEGEWLILARTNFFANKVSQHMKSMGVLFWREGSGWSVSSRVLKAAQTWTAFAQNNVVDYANLDSMFSFIKINKSERKVLKSRLQEAEQKQTLAEDLKKQLSFDGVDYTKKWYEVLDVPDKDRIYIQSVLRSGEKFDEKKPRIRVSTIHKAKGGEADNVVLLLNSSKLCQTFSNEDCERRVFYVGITRTKKNLHIIESTSKWSFQI